MPIGENIQTYNFSKLFILYVSRSFFFYVGINPMGVEEFDLLDEESFNLVESISC